MRTGTSRLTQIVLIAVLVLALAVPGMALAKPQAKNLHVKGPKGPKASQDAPITNGFNQPARNLEKRIGNVLAARAKRFAAADANITKRIDRLRSIATSLASEGASETLIADVNAKLDCAEEKLEMASQNESETVKAAFQAMLEPTEEYPTRRAAFFAAKAAGRQSVAYLKEARTCVREALHMLRGIVQSMTPPEDGAESGTGTSY